MKKILIQPTIDVYNSYCEFALKNRFGFEIIDFAFPDMLDSNYNSIVEKYKSYQNTNHPEYISQHGAFLDLFINSRDSLIRQVSEKRIKTNLDISKELSIGYTIFHSSFNPLIRHKSYVDNWVNRYVEFWTEQTKIFNITILLENLWDPNPDLLLEVINKSETDKIKICFDTGHNNIFSKVTLKEWFKKLGKHIVYIHMNDNKGDVDNELPVGDGNINWKEINDLINEFCDNPIVVFEVGNLENISKSMKYLEKNKLFPLL